MADLSLPLDNALAAVIALARLEDDLTDAEVEDQFAYSYGADAGVDSPTYLLWLELRAPARQAHQREVAKRLAALGAAAPRISVLVPVYRPDAGLLRDCVASVVAQSYGGWELRLCDDASADGATDALLAELAATDPRITVVHRAQNGGISAATNAAAEGATGDFLAFLDQDDVLEPGVLGDVAAAAVDQPDADVLYTDQDKLGDDGLRSEPYFKSGWNPDLLLSNMYLGHLLVVRRTLFERLGGFRSEFDGSQDYDLALRATEQARAVVHVPVVGYHWRRIEGSTASDYDAKPYADVAARKALAEAMERRGEAAAVESGMLPSTFRIHRQINGTPLVSIVIPFHDGAGLLRKCLDSLESTAGYEHFEVLLVDNRSWEPETRALVQRYSDDERVRLLTYDRPFNWSAINNWAAAQANGELLLFLNSDIEGRSDGWLSAMVEHAQRPEVGAVGARLLYPDGKIQHAGVVMGLGGGVAWHAFCFCPPGNSGYFGHTRMIRNYSAVTGACMMVPRAKFDEVGGFDESMAVAFNDIDFSMRLRQRGYLIVYTPFAELTHYEGASRGRGALEREETHEMFRRWETTIRRDPYFNPNLDPHRSEFRLRIGAEEVDPWEQVLK